MNPVASPDGRHMAFIRERIMNRSAVFVLPLTSDWRSKRHSDPGHV